MPRIDGIKYADSKNQHFTTSNAKRDEEYYQGDHIIKNTPVITGIKTSTDKFLKAATTYTKKGLKGTPNGNFYEYLAMGAIPFVCGSGMFIALYNTFTKNGLIRNYDAKGAGNKMAAAVVLYAVGKLFGQKLSDVGTKLATGIDMSMPYKANITEVPDFAGDVDLKAEEFHKVFESVDFPRWDLLEKQGAKNGNRYEYYDGLAEKMGYKEKLAAPDQVVQPKIREVVTKSRSTANIAKYLWAAIGVAIGNQDAFYSFRRPRTGLFKAISGTILCLRNSGKINELTGEKVLDARKEIKTIWGKFVKDVPTVFTDTWHTFKAATKQFYNGKGTFELRDKSYKYARLGRIMAYGLTALAAGTTLFGIVNARLGFKKAKEQKAEFIDKNSQNCVEV